jgi:hypothetical protein
VADYCRDLAISQRSHQPEHVTHAIQQRIRQDVIVKMHRINYAPATPAQVGRDDMKTGPCQRQQLISPRISELRKSVQQDHTRPSTVFEARLQQVHPHTVIVIDKPRSDASR